MAAITVIENTANSAQAAIAGGRRVKGKFTGPASYANPAGEALDIATAFSLAAGDTVENVRIFSDGGFSGDWASDVATIYDRSSATRTEVADTTNLSGETFFFEASVS